MKLVSSFALGLSALVLAAAPARASQRFVVDASGAGDFTEIQDAVDAALAGDLIVVLDGTYGPVEVAGKGIALLAEQGAQVQCGTLDVHDVPADEEFVVAGIVAQGTEPYPSPLSAGGTFVGNAGTVLVSRCELRGRDASFGPGLNVEVCPRVFVLDTLLLGGIGAGGPGLDALQSTLAVFDSTIQGAPDSVFTGGTGAALNSTELFLSGSTVWGGWGGDAPGDGGDGLRAVNQSVVHLLDTVVEAGSPGTHCGITCLDGYPGEDVSIDSSSTLHENPRDTARLLAVPSSTPDFGGFEITVSGEPGDRAELLFARAADLEVLPAMWSVRGLPTTQATLSRSTTNGRVRSSIPLQLEDRLLGVLAGTSLVSAFPILGLEEGASHETIFLQARITNGPDTFLTNPVPWVVVGGQRTLYVDADAPPGGDGFSWAHALRDLHDALDHELAVQDVWVAEGTYLPSESGDRNRSFLVRSRTSLYGGFAGTETDLSQRDPVAHPTILSGDLAGDDGPGFTNRSDNSRRVVEFEDGGRRIRMDGFTIRGAYASASAGGRGLSMTDNRRFVVSNCTFVDGTIGIWVGESDGTFVNDRFVANRQVNAAPSGGGAGHVQGRPSETLSFENCLFTGNAGSVHGGALHLKPNSGEIRIVSSTFVHNAAHPDFGTGGAILAEGPGTLGLHDSIFWGNTGSGTPEQNQVDALDGETDVLVTYSCFQDYALLPGHDNTTLDPLFVDAAGADTIPGTLDDDLRLGPGSPCIDAGRNGWLRTDVADLDRDYDRSEQIPLDLAGNPRRVDDPAVADTGSGASPVTDMGALERVP